MYRDTYSWGQEFGQVAACHWSTAAHVTSLCHPGEWDRKDFARTTLTVRHISSTRDTHHWPTVSDMIRCNTVYLRALKSWRDGQPNLVHGTETKKKNKTDGTTAWQDMAIELTQEIGRQRSQRTPGKQHCFSSDYLYSPKGKCSLLPSHYGHNNNNNKLAPYGTDGRLLLTADFKVTWHKN